MRAGWIFERCHDSQHNGIIHNGMSLRLMTLTITVFYAYDDMLCSSYAECHYTKRLYVDCHNAVCHHVECRYAKGHCSECCSAKCHFAHFIVQSVIILSDTECHYTKGHCAECHSAECHNTECLSVIMLSVIMLSVIMLVSKCRVLLR
jgi:hypothetical protein